MEDGDVEAYLEMLHDDFTVMFHKSGKTFNNFQQTPLFRALKIQCNWEKTSNLFWENVFMCLANLLNEAHFASPENFYLLPIFDNPLFKNGRRDPYEFQNPRSPHFGFKNAGP